MKKIKNVTVKEIVAECRNHISCMTCPFYNLIPCSGNFGTMKNETLEKKVDVKRWDL